MYLTVRQDVNRLVMKVEERLEASDKVGRRSVVCEDVLVKS